MLARDHYATLGVGPKASADDIEQAYRHLSRRYHPDINPGDPRAAAVFARVQAAYDVLADPEQRAAYDRGPGPTAAADGNVPLTVRVLPEANAGGSWREVIESLRDQARRCRPARGADIHANVDLPLVHAERGRRVPLALRRRVRCDGCGGRGRVSLQGSRPCERCHGAGEETFSKGSLRMAVPCSDCGGDGVLTGSPCADCGGVGTVSRDERIVVRLPPGVGDGQEVRIHGAGHAGARGGPAGDLVARVRVVPRPGYERRGPHLRVEVPLPVTLALLGGRIEVPTIEGERAPLRIPPLTQNGTEFRLRDRGLEMSDGRRGDMLVRVQIRIPESLDEDRKRLVRQLADRSARSRTPHPAPAGETER